MPASIFNGTAVKILKNILRFKDGTELTSTQVSDYLSNLTDNHEPTGVVDRTDSTISFVNGTRTFTIAPAVTSWDYYIDGVKYTKSSAENLVISAADGLHYIYYDGSTLSETTTWSEALLYDYALISIVRWDATNSIQLYLADERHGCIMDNRTHSYLHNTLGSVLESGGALTDITADENGNTNSDAQFGNAATVIWDEDLDFTLGARTSTSNIPVYYQTGADASNIWRTNETASYGVLTTGTGRAAWNENNAGTWQLTEVGNLDYVLSHVFAYNDTTRKFACVMGQADYATLADARDGALTEINNLTLDGFIFPEVKFLGTIIYQTSNNYTNAVQSRIRSTESGEDYVDLRDLGTVRGGTSGTVNDHGALSGLGDDDHTQYLNLETRNNLNVNRDVYAAICHDDLSLADSWDVSNISNATLTTDTTNHLSGTQSYLLTNVTGSGTEYIETTSIAVPKKARGKVNAVVFPYTYNGADGDFTAQFYDVTNTTLLETAVDIEASSNGEMVITCFFPSTTAAVNLRITVDTENNGKLLVLDDLVFTDDPFVYKDLLSTQTYNITQAQASVTNGGAEVEFNLATATIVNSGDQLIVAEDDSANTRTKFVAQKKLTAVISWTCLPTTANIHPLIYKEGVAYHLGTAAYTGAAVVSTSTPMELEAGEYFSVGLGDTLLSASSCSMKFTATAETEHVVRAEKTGIQTYKIDQGGASFLTASASANLEFNLATATIENDYIHREIIEAVNVSNETRFTAKEDCTVIFDASIYLTTLSTQILVVRSGITIFNGTLTWASNRRSIANVNVRLKKDQYLTIYTTSTLNTSTSRVSFVAIPDFAQRLSAVPTPRTAYVKDVQASATLSGTFTSGSYQTRTLNTVEGDTEIVSLSSNQISLVEGTYDIEIEAPAYSVEFHKVALGLISGTGAGFTGVSSYASATHTAQTNALAKGRVVVTAPAVYEVLHRCSATKTTDGFGRRNSFGDNETYTQVKITKIK